MTHCFQANMNLNQLMLHAVCRPIAAAVDDLLLIWATMDAEEWLNLLWYLPL